MLQALGTKSTMQEHLAHTCEAALACRTAAWAAANPTSLTEGVGATTGSASSTGCTWLPAKLATFTEGRWGRLPTCGSSGSVLSAAALFWHLQHGLAISLSALR